MPLESTRRTFLQATTAALLAAGYAATARGFAANETIHVGCIGTGGRCRKLMQTLGKMPGVRLAAVCDVWDVHLEMGRALADPKAFVTKDRRQIFDRKDLDAVLIAAPDHWHAAMTGEACQAGKDVYVEKPLTHDVAEGQSVIDAQNRYARIVQVGMQQRSMPQFQSGLEIVRSGQLGKIHKVHLTWNRNRPPNKLSKLEVDPKSVDWKQFVGSARQQPFDPYRLQNWRWFWDFGGGILTDLMAHYLDVANWYLELDHPAVATTIGDNFQTQGLWETPDTIQTLLRYPDREVQIYFEGTFASARSAAMLEFVGSEGTLRLDHFDQPDGALLHLSNWLECVRSRKQPSAPAEAGVSAVTGAHLGNRAYRRGQVAHWS